MRLPGSFRKLLGLSPTVHGALMMILVGLSACHLGQSANERTDPGESDTKVCIAHRGASAYAPEHTLAAYQLALDMGADFVEQDLQMTSDGVLVCLHDTSLERTTNVETVYPERFDPDSFKRTGRKTYPVVLFTLDEIRRLDAGSWFGAQFESERIPTFQEAIDLVRGKAGIYPELKEPGYYEKYGLNMVDATIELLEKNRLNRSVAQQETPVLIQSFSPAALKEMKAKAGDTYRLIQLVAFRQRDELISDEALDEVAAYAYGLGPTQVILRGDPTRIPAVQSRGLKLHPYTVNQRNLPPEFTDVAEFTEYLLYQLNVDGVFTDHPDLFPKSAAQP